jgi:hypothetical protein
MSIQVTPIPKLTSFGTPGLTLTTANAAGSSGVTTTMRTDASILVYDTTVPASVGAANATGSATVSARRDHVHEGTALLTTIISGSRSASAGAGDQALTGVGFSPTGLIALGTVESTTFASWGLGDDAVAETSSAMAAGNVTIRDGDLIYASALDGNYMTARVKTLDADGCTLTWTKGGTGYDVVYRILFMR